MSQLEERVKPILWPLAQGKTAVITRDEGAIIAQWMAKTALILESSTPPGEAKAQDDVHNFNVMNAAIANTYPVQFATWAFPVVPNEATQMRSKVGTVFFGDHQCAGHHVRASLVQIREIAICSVHAADRRVWEERVEPFLAVAAPALFPEYGDFHLHRDEAYSVDRANALALDLLRGIVGEPTFYPPAASPESGTPA
ncbi:hypothetical protein [Microbacterium sp. J1-1]|uniref:hypothetical protein n=1 Tax=Microbacterium sp. J1-1 TaxID=2992441 RepID=UPI00211450EA|nr:hypothetical protein [Microbacterium sp. J1-1]UUE19311.1 hypothetical protein LRQ07_10870 [Microbacterium sp. J1-1]